MSVSDTYWVKREIHVSVVSPDGEYSTTVRKPFARIGSLEGSEVLLDENRAARRCLYLHATEEGLFFIRLDDFREHQGSGWLRPGRTLRVGDYEITARADPPAESIPEVDIELDAIGSAVLPRPVISVRYAHQQITQRCLDQRLTLVGRKLPSALRVQHNTLSTFHCVLYWDAGILWVIDLLSSNRTRLNGHVVDSGELRVGRSIRLGKLKIRFDKLTETGFPPSREIVELGQAASGEVDNLLTTQRDLDEQLAKPAPPPDGSEAAIAGERPFHTTRATQPEIEIGKARESVEDEGDFTEVERWGLQERVAEQKRQRRDGEAENEADKAQPDARAQALEDETGRGRKIASEREEVWAVGRKSLQEQLAALGQQLHNWETEREAQKAQFAGSRERAGR
jgi:pSer/pThr/pTyr-binding forkhead associated (FHA) protein